MEILVLYIAACLLVGWFASYTTLGFGGGFLLSLLLTPVTGFIIMLFYPSKKLHNEKIAAMKGMNPGSGIKPSAADELAKMKTLLDSGAISSDEYEKAKAKILSQ